MTSRRSADAEPPRLERLGPESDRPSRPRPLPITDSSGLLISCNNGVQLLVHLTCAEYSAVAIHTYRFAFCCGSMKLLE